MTIETLPQEQPQDHTTPPWKNRVLEKRAMQLAQIPSAWHLPAPLLANPPASSIDTIRASGILSADGLAWTETADIRDLVELIKSRRVTSEALTTAFCKRAAIAQQVTRCLTEIFFDKALKRARELDDHLIRTGEVVGPLHGIPVSVKDRFDVEGYDTTVGWVGLTNKPAKSNSSIVQLLESMGAVLYVKTNVPQSLMMSDSYNHVFGQSVNAFNHALISGGSSGGEGALLGSRGSVLGIGTDIGGSIRVPSNLQGLYSICPTTGRVPWDCSFLHQHYLIPPVAGPMATSLATTEYFMETLLASSPWNVDPNVVPIPWRKELAGPPANRKLKLGVVFDDGVVKPQPPVARAMRETVDALRAAGHEVIEWDTSLHIAITNLWTKGILADGGQHCRSLCKIVDEPLIEGMVVGKETDHLSHEEREQFEGTKLTLQTAFLKQWVSSEIDALLMPVLPWVGYKPKTWVKSKQWLGYTAMWNLLDYAGVTVPVARADRGLDSVGSGCNAEWEGHSIRNESDAFNYLQYDADLVHGMPICVQIVGGRFGEEKAVAVGKVVDELMNPKPSHP
ncbi:Amidasefungi [Penicillium desertorum]|uniref:amidase n=1 Tax=Penicillium desertorum TaxID=1303715 RepID=A0A9W9WRX3_9EURO|nr:Amidasefungi [Penicillium desertorum]